MIDEKTPGWAPPAPRPKTCLFELPLPRRSKSSTQHSCRAGYWRRCASHWKREAVFARGEVEKQAALARREAEKARDLALQLASATRAEQVASTRATAAATIAAAICSCKVRRDIRWKMQHLLVVKDRWWRCSNKLSRRDTSQKLWYVAERWQHDRAVSVAAAKTIAAAIRGRETRRRITRWKPRQTMANVLWRNVSNGLCSICKQHVFFPMQMLRFTPRIGTEQFLVHPLCAEIRIREFKRSWDDASHFYGCLMQREMCDPGWEQRTTRLLQTISQWRTACSSSLEALRR